MTEKEIREELEKLVPLVKKDNDTPMGMGWSSELHFAWSKPLMELATKSGKKRVVDVDRDKDGNPINAEKITKIGIGDIVYEVR